MSFPSAKRILALGLLLALGVTSGIQLAQAEEAPHELDLATDMLERTNRLRARYGLSPYRINPQLNMAAQSQADWLVETGSRTHYRSDGSKPSDRIAETGYTWQGWCCGENYYLSIDATRDMVFDFWTWSPMHFVNLAHREFQEMGVARAEKGVRIAYVLVFANPFDPNAPPPIAEPVVEVIETPEPTPQPEPEPQIDAVVTNGTYRVQAGDTLFGIAVRHNTTVSALAAANGLGNQNLVYIGQQLIIPGSEAFVAIQDAGVLAAPPPETAPEAAVVEAAPPVEASVPVASNGTHIHIVQPGDTLLQIAVRYDTDLATLAQLNGLVNADFIFAGQQLIVPGGIVGEPIPVAAPPITQTAIQTQANPALVTSCGGLRPTSPLDGLPNGRATFYWDAAPASGITTYLVNIYNAENRLVSWFTTEATRTTLTGNVSAESIGGGFQFSWEVAALADGQVVCGSERVNLMRES